MNLTTKGCNFDMNDARDHFIRSMRAIANSVAVVTTNGTAGRHGATVSSFCSVSADPPSMLVCLHDSSRISECVKANGVFSINVLPQEMSEIADRFAGKEDASLSDRFEGLDHQTGSNGCPSISGSVSFQCSIDTHHLSGSHRVFIGRVENIDGMFSRPLTYLDGEYRPWSY